MKCPFEKEIREGKVECEHSQQCHPDEIDMCRKQLKHYAKQYRNDFPDFCEEFYGVKLRWYQKLLLRVVGGQLDRARNPKHLVSRDLTRYPYKQPDAVFNDYYSGRGIKHNKKPDTKFVYGDIVTTDCGWDLGFHSGVDYRVYSLVEPYAGEPGRKPMYGGELDWYKTGVNVTWEQWTLLCEKFRGRGFDL